MTFRTVDLTEALALARTLATQDRNAGATMPRPAREVVRAMSGRYTVTFARLSVQGKSQVRAQYAATFDGR